MRTDARDERARRDLIARSVEAGVPDSARLRMLLEAVTGRPVPVLPCRVWKGTLNRHGYGRFERELSSGRVYLAHVASYLLAGGVIPEGHHIDHLCEVEACIEPQHLHPKPVHEHLRDHAIRNQRARSGITPWRVEHAERALPSPVQGEAAPKSPAAQERKRRQNRARKSRQKLTLRMARIGPSPFERRAVAGLANATNRGAPQKVSPSLSEHHDDDVMGGGTS